MRITLIGIGTRGDVQPLVALAQGLQRRGHTVVLIADQGSRPLAAVAGVPFSGVAMDIRRMLDTAMRALHADPLTAVRLLQAGRRELAACGVELADRCREALPGCDLFIGGPAVNVASGALVEWSGVPYVSVHFQPNIPTRAFPSPDQLAPFLPNRWSHGLHKRLGDWLGRPLANTLRERLGLAPLSAVRTPRVAPVLTFCAASPVVVPRPHDWPADVSMPGYFFLEDDGKNLDPWPAELEAFLEAGPPPLYIGFGSTRFAGAAEQSGRVIAAVRRAGVRAVVGRGWGGLCVTEDHPSPTLHVVTAVDHQRLFRRVAGVAHHGGAGTTAAALTAGRPVVTMPFFGDQFFWAERVERLGCSAGTLAHTKLSSASLAPLLRRLADDRNLAGRAAAVGEQIRQENGVANAIDRIETWYSQQVRST